MLEDTIMSIVEKCVSHQFDRYQHQKPYPSPFKAEAQGDLSQRSRLALASQ